VQHRVAHGHPRSDVHTCWVDFQILGYVAKKNGVEIDQQDLRAPLPGTRHRRAGGRQAEATGVRPSPPTAPPVVSSTSTSPPPMVSASTWSRLPEVLIAEQKSYSARLHQLRIRRRALPGVSEHCHCRGRRWAHPLSRGHHRRPWECARRLHRHAGRPQFRQSAGACRAVSVTSFDW
jgi:hypothetical protein